MTRILMILLLTSMILNFGCPSNDTEKYMKDLSSENVVVKNTAIYHLGKKREKHAVPKLIELLNSDQSKETKLSAIEALGKIGEGSSVTMLINILKENDSEIRIAAVESLGKIKDPKAVQPLLNILNDKNNERDIQLSAIWALGNIRDKSAISALRKLLDDQREYIRYNAAQSLKKIGQGKQGT